VLSFAVLALVLQWIAIYGFNALQKNGAPWRDGSAVYYALRQHGMLTGLGAWLSGVLSFGTIRMLTFGALAIEAGVAVLLIIPLKTQMTRMIAWLLVCCLHLSIASVLHLGTFSWAMMIMFVALIPREAWGALGAWLRVRRPERTLLVDGASPLAIVVCRVIKRFDALDKIRFRPAEGDGVGRFVVVDPASGRRARGLKGLALLADALPMGRGMVAGLNIPGLSGLVKRVIRRAERTPEQYADYLELTPLAREDEPQLSPAREFLERAGSTLGEVAVVVLLVCCGSQLLIENQAVPERLKPTQRPAWMAAVVIYPRLFQGWSMFAPAPPLDDVAVVVDGRTKDGRHFDPLTGQEPSFDVSARGQRRRNCEWYYFDRRLSEDRFKAYLGGVRDFLKNHHEITGRPQDQLVAFDVWSVSQAIALPGAPKSPPVKSKVLSYGLVRD
jgi:hypothetical protein